MTRILIAEDSATQREGLRHTLTTQGYDVIAVGDGREAWARLADAAPSLVVTDILMPHMDGYALCRAIKGDPRLASIPVVLLTSLSDRKDVIAALECGADGFIGKPFADDYLLSRIREVIANRNLPDRDKRERGVELSDGDRTYLIKAERPQILDLLLSVYEVAMRRNEELAKAQASLRSLNAQLEQKVRDRTRKLEESNKALEAFCYSVAHDLRAPLRSIQGYVTLLNEDYAQNLDDQARIYSSRACSAASRMDRMILDLLAYGRVSHAEAKMERVDLREEIAHVLAEFEVEIAAKKAAVTVNAQAITLTTSRVLLGQILSNLLSNALKFVRDQAPPRVAIEARAEGGKVVLSVRDQGIGMDLTYREKIFNLFEKLETKDFPGTGIGLAIVQKAAERIGGTIALESTLGTGSCFTVTISGADVAAS